MVDGVAIHHMAIGVPPQVRVRQLTRDLQRRLHNLCERRAQNLITIPDFLRGVGHNIRWKVAINRLQ